MDINKLVQSASSVKLSGGIFTKACTVLITVSVAIAGVAYFTKNIWVSVGAILLIFILTFFILWRLISFALKNPQAAILEGAQFLVHEHIQMSKKDGEITIQDLTTIVEKIPINSDPKSEVRAQEPDVNPKDPRKEDMNG